MSTYKLIDVSHNPTEDKIFFGDYSGFIRIDQVSHEAARTLKDNAESNTWFSKEVDMKDDKTKFDTLPEDAKTVFKLNICYQVLMDSFVTAGIGEYIIDCISTPIWDLLYRRISYEESIHAESYSYCLSQVFGSDTPKILNLVYEDKHVQSRMQEEIKLFGDLHEAMEQDDIEVKKVALLRAILALYCLESIKFPFSFLVTFTINDSYSNAIPGFTNNIRLIAHDELNTHVPTGVLLMRTLRDEEHQGFKHLFDNGWFKETILGMVKDVVEQELAWAKYLFDDKEVKGINYNISEYFIKWRANISLRMVGISDSDNPYSSFNDNSTTRFFDNCRNVNKQNAALQETSTVSYQKGALTNDL